MSLADLASLAGLVSSIAVLVSLLFVGLQIRQANRNQRSLMQQGRSARNVDILTRLTDPRIGDIMLRVFKGETLADAEYLVLYGYMASVFWSYEDCFLQFRSGTLEAKSWASDVATLRRLLTRPAYRAVWRTVRDALDDEYRSFVDNLVAEARHSAPGDSIKTLKQFIAEETQASQSSQKSL